jgi:nitrogen fixation NifU-like protein
MNDSLELYQELILDHGRRPRNRRVIADRSHFAHSENPSCGDEVAVFLRVDQHGVIRDAAFQGQSCAIATASASLMTEVLAGKTTAQAKSLSDCLHALTTGAAEPPLVGMEAEVERLSVLSGLRGYPSRVRCATLAWQTMVTALKAPKEAL